MKYPQSMAFTKSEITFPWDFIKGFFRPLKTILQCAPGLEVFENYNSAGTSINQKVMRIHVILYKHWCINLCLPAFYHPKKYRWKLEYKEKGWADA